MDRQDGNPKDVPTRERLATLGRAAADAMHHKAEGAHETEDGRRYTVPVGEAEALIADWPDAPREGARQMIERYGPPDEATPTKLFWYRKGPWKRIQVTRDVLVHNFPSPHSDFLTMWIDYHVPVDLFDEIARYDGSCLVDRTAGEVGARCDSEAANTITLNLMHEIVTGKLSVDEARSAYAESMVAYAMGRSSPYAEGLQFVPPAGGTEDEDEPLIIGAMARQAVAKIRDVLTGRNDEAPRR